MPPFNSFRFVWRLCSASRLIAVGGLVWLLVTQDGFAEDPTADLSIDTIAESRVHSPAGDSYVPAERLHIGEEIFYTLRVRNTSEKAIQDAVVVKALPRNTRYVSESAVGPAASVTYSTNGGRTFASPDQLNVVATDGTTRSATADDYTHIRWQLRHPLAPGAIALLRFRGAFK